MSVIETILVIFIVGGAAVLLTLSFIKKANGTGGGCGGGCGGGGCSTEETCQSDEDSKTDEESKTSDK